MNGDAATPACYKPIRVESLRSGKSTDFALYIKYGAKHTLYKPAGSLITSRDLERFANNDIQELYVGTDDVAAFSEYTERNVCEILNDPEIPFEEKGELLYHASSNFIDDVFHDSDLNEELTKCRAMVEQIIACLLQDKICLEQLTAIVNHHFYTYSHLVHVTALVVALLHTTYPDIFPDELRDAGIGAMLHDFGKIFIPRTILDKPGKLDAEEWAIIKEHPAKGYEFLRQRTDLSQNVLDIVISHHEKWDGSGYPSRKKGPVVGRNVLAVTTADVFCALVTDRAYRAALTPERALEIMENEMVGSFEEGMLKALRKIVFPPENMDNHKTLAA